jgi:hypothetical protein
MPPERSKSLLRTMSVGRVLGFSPHSLIRKGMPF